MLVFRLINPWVSCPAPSIGSFSTRLQLSPLIPPPRRTLPPNQLFAVLVHRHCFVVCAQSTHDHCTLLFALEGNDLVIFHPGTTLCISALGLCSDEFPVSTALLLSIQLGGFYFSHSHSSALLFSIYFYFSCIPSSVLAPLSIMDLVLQGNILSPPIDLVEVHFVISDQPALAPACLTERQLSLACRPGR